MKLIISLVVVSPLLLFSSCKDSDSFVEKKPVENRRSSQSLGVDKKNEEISSSRPIDQFWRNFQENLKKNDISEISKLTRFPLDGNGGEDTQTREGFERHFKEIFPDVAIRTLLNESPQSIELESSNGGKAIHKWRIHHFEKGETSVGEWAVYYFFSKSAYGDIMLTSILFVN